MGKVYMVNGVEDLEKENVNKTCNSQIVNPNINSTFLNHKTQSLKFQWYVAAVVMILGGVYLLFTNFSHQISHTYSSVNKLF